MKNTQVAATAVVTDRPVGRGLPAGGLPEISGYQLIERIGLGGYGEVWRALGPGGFPKAVKILYGQIDGPQAETELKSLNLMRELRHPFLLNVERVEFVNGKLIVVTELADRGLDQRFDEAVRAGARGIPREELIAYLRDVADALDFMSEHHGLQHLDIKPENLLIQGNHAKVGDFGLTKCVGLTNVSMVNGFTPLYAPPELFEGQPSCNSDQYSLAIVYQMMLTGIPPFNGRTAAHLTSQHLRGTPDLTALPVSDRGIVARALSRNPATRFSGCRMFIDELAKRKASTSSTLRALNADAALMVSGLTQTVDPASVGKSASTPLRPARPLPPLPAGDGEETLRPTLFIAVGGLGIRVACRLFSKIREGFQGAVPPTFAFLCPGFRQVRNGPGMSHGRRKAGNAAAAAANPAEEPAGVPQSSQFSSGLD
jgi:eukaryotic-like serine/threonine-protein kinase